MARPQIYVRPDGTNYEIIVGKKHTLGFVVLNGNTGKRRDLTSDTLTAEAKSIDIVTPVALSVSFTADADQSTNKGLAWLVVPAAEATTARAGTINVNLLLDDGSGAEVTGAFQTELVVNDAV